MNRVTVAFLSGGLCAHAGLSLYQDALGLERYLARAREHWVDAVYTVPIAAVMLLIAVAGLFWAHQEAQ